MVTGDRGSGYDLKRGFLSPVTTGSHIFFYYTRGYAANAAPLSRRRHSRRRNPIATVCHPLPRVLIMAGVTTRGRFPHTSAASAALHYALCAFFTTRPASSSLSVADAFFTASAASISFITPSSLFNGCPSSDSSFLAVDRYARLDF